MFEPAGMFKIGFENMASISGSSSMGFTRTATHRPGCRDLGARGLIKDHEVPPNVREILEIEIELLNLMDFRPRL